MKKVCFVINSLFGGGAEKQVINLAQEFADRGYEPHIITANEDIDYDVGNLSVHSLPPAEGIPANLFERIMDSKSLGELVTKIIIRLMQQHKLSYSFLYRREIKQLQHKIKELGPFAAVFSNLPYADFLCIAAGINKLYCCLHVDIESKIKFPWPWTRNLKFRKMREWFVVSCYRNFYKGQNIITVSDELRERTLALGIKPASIQCIYNMFDFDKVLNLSEEYDPEEEDYIIYVGRFTLIKRLDLLIDAYRLSGISQKLLLLGQGDEEANILGKIARDNLQGRVMIKQFTKNPYPYITKAKALVLASDIEGLPTVLIEALVLGTPVVSTSCPTGPKEILTGELAEFLSPLGDTQALANNIRKVIDSPLEIKDKHIAKFHKETSFSKYLAILEQ